MRTRGRGFTLVEMMIVMAMIGLATLAIITLSIQSMKIYASTSSQIEPQASLMLAMKNMQWEMREAMFIRLSSDSTACEVIIPIKDSSGSYVMSTEDGFERLECVDAFTGFACLLFPRRAKSSNPANAIPDAVNGNTIFRITTGSDTTVGTDIISNGSTLSSSYTGAQTIITGVVPAQTSFAYADYSGSGNTAFSDGMNAQIVKISVTVPVTVNTPSGNITQNQTLSSEFCLRNFETL